MRDHKARAPAHERVHGTADGELGARVHARRRLVQDEDRRVVEQHARDGQQLTLALADALGIVSHTRVVALRHSAHKEVDLSGTCGRDNLLARCLGTAIGDVLGNGAIEQPGVLQHHAKLLAQLAAIHAARVHAVEGNATTVDLVEAHEQIDERGLTRTRGSHHRDLLTRLGGKRHVAHKRLVGRIAKAHMLKSDTALHLAWQLGGGRWQRIGFHLGLVEQVEHALGARQRAL